MDIRSFFGGKKAAPVEAKADTQSPPPAPESWSVVAISAVVQAGNAPTSEEQANVKSVESLVVSQEAIPKDITDLIDWPAGQSVPYKAVADAFEKIGATSGRLEKESILCK
jgi:hypothetical protein